MKQNLLLRSRYIVVATVWLLNFSCQSRNEEDAKTPDTSGEVTQPDESAKPQTPTEPETIDLKGTRWKLKGNYDVQSNYLTIFKPEGCDECYTLTFDTDYTAIAHSINGSMKLDLLNLDPSVYLVDSQFCERYYKDGKDYCDSDDFWRAVTLTEAWSVTYSELKLFYLNRTKYLYFKIITQ